jgi:diguanylate cyclase (GGDEF)-like protein
MLRTRFVLPLVLMLGVATIVAVVLLQQRADESRDSQQTLGEIKPEVERLQTAPLQGIPGAGGSPESARRQFQTSRRLIAARLAKLDDGSAPPALRQVARPLRRNVAALERIMAGNSPRPLAGDETAARMPSPPTASHVAIKRLLDAAGREYRHRAERSAAQATIGSAVAIALLLAAFAFFYRRAQKLARENDRLLATSRHEAITDGLTELRNRRALMNDLERELSSPETRPLALGLYDLDGFKQYNDTFGHPAGDALLARLGEHLKAAVQGTGYAYRMGGDEFCVLVPMHAGGEPVLRRAAEALSETGEGFAIGCSYGAAYIPAEASSGEEALRLADQRLYQEKAGRSTASRQTTDVLLTLLGERHPGLSPHLSTVAQLAELTARRLGLPAHEVKRVRLATELHDIGKAGIPEEILNKPGELDEHEWAFVRRHTLIGERIVRAAPSLAHTAELVRSSHERYDGRGYPDALKADEITLEAGIVAVCDAFEAMISERPYRPTMNIDDALAELRRHAGTQFHPQVVEAFCAAQQSEIVASAAG